MRTAPAHVPSIPATTAVANSKRHQSSAGPVRKLHLQRMASFRNNMSHAHSLCTLPRYAQICTMPAWPPPPTATNTSRLLKIGFVSKKAGRDAVSPKSASIRHPQTSNIRSAWPPYAQICTMPAWPPAANCHQYQPLIENWLRFEKPAATHPRKAHRPVFVPALYLMREIYRSHDRHHA